MKTKIRASGDQRTSPKPAPSEDGRPIIQVLDFFSGCGGMSYGFTTCESPHVRYDVKGALDIDQHANATYHRMLGVRPETQDIRDLLDPEVFERVSRGWELDRSRPLIVIGCAPCQGFSSHRKKDDRVDARNELLSTFASVALRLQPDVIVMENVPEMLRAEHWQHFERWRGRMLDIGYTVRIRIYNLAAFGVPQERYRALIIAARDWQVFGMPEPTLSPSEYVTVRDAIGDLRPLDAGGADSIDPMHVTSRHRQETVDLIRLIPLDGGSRRSLPEGVGPECVRKVDGFRDVYGRLFWDRPAVAITSRCRTPSCGRFTHPEQHRGLSVREAALLQGFPPKYFFEGPFDDKFKQIGNAVSPMFSNALALHLGREWGLPHDARSRVIDTSADLTKAFEKSFSSSIAGIKRESRAAGGRTLAPALAIR